MKLLIDECRDWWRFWSVRIQLVCATLAGWMWFDPASLLAVWRMMPSEIHALLPDHFVTLMGAVLFVLSLLGVLARQVKQPKLEEKRNAAGHD